MLKRTENVKYLDVYLDDKLHWSYHVKYLSLQLARYSGIFYRMSKLVPTSVLIFLYYTLAQGWGTFSKTKVLLVYFFLSGSSNMREAIANKKLPLTANFFGARLYQL